MKQIEVAPTDTVMGECTQQTSLLADALEFIFCAPKRHFIGGQWVESPSSKTCDVLDPCTDESLTSIPLGGTAEVDAAVDAAQKAFPAWAAMPPVERAILLHRLADNIERELPVLAQIEALDVGKAVVNAESFDIPFGAACIRYFADISVQANYDLPLAVRNMDARVHRAPYGPCGFIFPWNFPFTLLLWNIAPALAAGNTVVVKPAAATPLSTLYVCKLAAEAGIPAGVINVVLGNGRGVGSALASNEHIRRMSFTGSTSVGRSIAEACGRNLVPVKLELGGKGAAVVCEDADIDDAASKLAAAITLNTGQVCCTATRWIIHESIYDRFAECARNVLKAVKIGPSLNRDTEMGPFATRDQLQTVLDYLQRGKNEGAKIVLEGALEADESLTKGYYMRPVLLEGNADNICCREELFGPVAYLLKFRQDEDAIKLTNSLRYGLADSVWSSDLARANRIAEQLVAGNTWINAHNVFAYGLPYGGVNQSGMGGGVNSPETFNDYLRSETIARPLA